jgi:hypothetical protein
MRRVEEAARDMPSSEGHAPGGTKPRCTAYARASNRLICISLNDVNVDRSAVLRRSGPRRPIGRPNTRTVLGDLIGHYLASLPGGRGMVEPLINRRRR